MNPNPIWLGHYNTRKLRHQYTQKDSHTEDADKWWPSTRQEKRPGRNPPCQHLGVGLTFATAGDHVPVVQTTPSGDLVVATLADPPTHHKDPSRKKPGAYATGTSKFSSNHPEWFWGYIAHHHNFYLKAAVCTKDYHAGALKAVRALTVRTESAVNRNSGNDRQFPHEKRQNISEEGLKNQIASTDITWWLPLLISIYQL